MGDTYDSNCVRLEHFAWCEQREVGNVGECVDNNDNDEAEPNGAR